VVSCCGCDKACQRSHSSFSKNHHALVFSSHLGQMKSRLGGCCCDQPVLAVCIGKENLELRPGFICKGAALPFTNIFRGAPVFKMSRNVMLIYGASLYGWCPASAYCTPLSIYIIIACNHVLVLFHQDSSVIVIVVIVIVHVVVVFVVERWYALSSDPGTPPPPRVQKVGGSEIRVSEVK
jgi:hypothetical protein